MSQERFQHWLTDSAVQFAATSIGICNESLAAYHDNYANASDKAAINLGIKGSGPAYELCRVHASCILEHTSEYNKATMAAANVLLGLLPVILVTMAPTMDELALIAIHRPVLASLLSMASPAILIERVFKYDDPGKLLERENSDSDKRNPWNLPRLHANSALLLGLLQHLLTLAGVGNLLYLVVQLSLSAVLSWGCTRTWPLYVWMFAPVVFHWMAHGGYYLTLNKSSKGIGRVAVTPHTDTELQVFLPHTSIDESNNKGPMVRTPVELTQPQGASSSQCKNPHAEHLRAAQHTSMKGTRFLYKRWWHIVLAEFTSTVGHYDHYLPSRTWQPDSTTFRLGVILSYASSFLSFFHTIFAIVTFSGLLFVTAIDAVGSVGMRLVLSALISRLIVIVEIGGLRTAAG
jgi:hypothetical protein